MWYRIATVPGDAGWAWLRWHDESTGIIRLAAGHDAAWWRRQGATHWRPVTPGELVAYFGPHRRPDRG